jgi:hypothetical protein
MSSLPRTLLAAAAVSALIAVGASSSANATVVGYDFSDGAQSITNINNIAISDPATIIQGINSSGSAIGQAFTETGTLNLTNYYTNTGSTGTISNAYFSYTLSGTEELVNGTPELVFNKGGTITLNVNGSAYATFTLVTGGSTGEFQVVGGNGTTVTTIQILAKQTSGPSNVFTQATGGPITFELVNDLPTITSTSSPTACPAGISSAECVTIGAVSSGTLLAAVPEPASLAVFGMGLLGMGLLRRRKSSRGA